MASAASAILLFPLAPLAPLTVQQFIMIKDILFSDFGEKLAGRSGILQLMDDLGKPLPAGIPAYRLGGGNPARIPAVETAYRRSMQNMLSDGESFENVLAHYDAPQDCAEISYRRGFVDMAEKVQQYP